ncbi:hypothetical protein GWI33_005458 [Rhynchophorus ferrugineus]|uniref:Uncharacterized protein n=1 Tax=Rhynchophorus ferrugineus TaxID=354439 RepID=A0A834MEH9_RHYFE|nr:hypothetical protein GWI33_005458 [Rhynchophorus ferrugineus]
MFVQLILDKFRREYGASLNAPSPLASRCCSVGAPPSPFLPLSYPVSPLPNYRGFRNGSNQTMQTIRAEKDKQATGQTLNVEDGEVGGLRVDWASETDKGG